MSVLNNATADFDMAFDEEATLGREGGKAPNANTETIGGMINKHHDYYSLLHLDGTIKGATGSAPNPVNLESKSYPFSLQVFIPSSS